MSLLPLSEQQRPPAPPAGASTLPGGISWPLERPVNLACSVMALPLNNHFIKGVFFIEHP